MVEKVQKKRDERKITESGGRIGKGRIKEKESGEQNWEMREKKNVSEKRKKKEGWE